MGRLDRSPRANWVENKGGLPDYIDRIAVHLHDKGMPISQAIAVAINAVKKACATGDLNYPGMQNENSGSRAEACAAVAQWEALKASNGAPDLLEASVALGIASPDGLALASWNSMLHPRNPAGAAGGGKFTSKGSAPKGKGAKGSAAAKAAQAQAVYDNFLKMNPQQRADFLAGLSNPQLAALYKVANKGNSNDPATRASLIAIKGQMSARNQSVSAGVKAAPGGGKAKKAAAGKKSGGGAAMKSGGSKTALGLAQTAGVRDTLALASRPAQAGRLALSYRYHHGWVLIGGDGKPVADKKNKSNADLAAMKASAATMGPHSKAAADYNKAVAETKTGGAPKLPTGVAKRAIISTTPGVGDRRRIAARLSDKDLHATDKAFDKRAIASGAHGQVDKNQRVVKQEIATRDAAKGLRADHPDVIKAKIKRLQALKKSGQLNSLTADKQIRALNTKLAQVQQAAKNRVRLSHQLNLSASANASSGDGAQVTVTAGLKSPRDIRVAVAGHGKVPPHRQAAYRKKVKTAAKAMGPAGMRHVPPAWMKD